MDTKEPESADEHCLSEWESSMSVQVEQKSYEMPPRDGFTVADIWACYKEWGDKGAFFLTEPLPNPDGWEWRCYMRDPDGYIIEVGQYTQFAIDWFNNHS
jgi:hypothetical protein